MNTLKSIAATFIVIGLFAVWGTSAEAWATGPSRAPEPAPASVPALMPDRLPGGVLAQDQEPPPTVVLRAATSDHPAVPLQATPSETPTALPPATATPAQTAAATATDPAGGTATATSAASSVPVPTGSVEPTSSTDRPILVLQDSDVSPGSPASGSEFEVRLEVKNVGSSDAEHVQLSLASDVFLPKDQGSNLYKEEIDAGETRPFNARMRVESSTVTGVYSLGIVMRWDDAQGRGYSDQTSIGIQVQGSTESRPLVTVKSAQAPTRCVPGAPFSVTFEMANIGGWEARNVVIAPAMGTLALVGAAPPPVNIGPGGTASVTLRLMASPVAEPGAVQQVFDIRYDDPDSTRYNDTYQLGINVSDSTALGPLPVITHYTFGDELHPGEVFELAIEVMNVGARDALRTRLALGGTTRATSSQDGTSSGVSLGVFAPLGTGNVSFIGRLAAGATASIEQEMVVDGGAEPGVYLLDMGFSFVDPDGVPHAAGEVIGLLVSREVSIVINPITVITSTVVGETVPFSVEVINSGDSTVNIGNVDVQGGRYMDVVEGATTYVGPLDAGSPYPIDATLLPVAPTDKATVVVVVHYTDDFNREQTYEEPFVFEIVPAMERPVDEADEPEGSDEPMWSRVIKGFLGLGASPEPMTTAPDDSEGEPAMQIEVETAP